MSKLFAFKTSNGKKVVTPSTDIVITEHSDEVRKVTINGVNFSTRESLESLYNKLNEMTGSLGNYPDPKAFAVGDTEEND